MTNVLMTNEERFATEAPLRRRLAVSHSLSFDAPVSTEAQPGRGLIELELIAGRTAVTRLRANSPMKLLAPRQRTTQCAWVAAGSYGGGLVAGDDLQLTARVGDGAKLFLGTQASTKIYRAQDGLGCRQQLDMIVGEDSIAVIGPDPLTPFSGAIFQQTQRFRVARSATLVLIDWITSGRVARNERWAFERYCTKTDIFLEDRHVFRDALRLDAGDGPLDTIARTGGFDCLATVVMIGNRLQAAIESLLSGVQKIPIRPGASLLCAASPLHGGAVIRLAGRGPEQVGAWLKDHLSFVAPLLGSDPWRRKW